jgi:ACS family D-galactonate transporter-like MFS transporter
MSFAGNLAGVLTPIYVGLIVSVTGSFFIALMVFATSALVFAASGFLINYNKKVGM